MRPDLHAHGGVLPEQILRLDIGIFAVQREDVLEALAEPLRPVQVLNQQDVGSQRTMELQVPLCFDSHVAPFRVESSTTKGHPEPPAYVGGCYQEWRARSATPGLSAPRQGCGGVRRTRYTRWRRRYIAGLSRSESTGAQGSAQADGRSRLCIIWREVIMG